ncbi:GNAT family N-acetyltransferase [Vallitalea pronyensis]|uniref:GNAT family N-acetyltransferase n=1 Tax=Vallitalea pronyensis TaxID=1348613 RepID=A0A8J8SJF3_9FIRM|nr:GNAT family protein [Vallitalea pronyensis]QUI25422.1 GNAT family N-acetyltransferase [Vallitalea pronyensis]
MLIETKRLKVRTFKLEDWQDLQEYVSQKSVMTYERDWDTSDASCQEKVKYFSEGDTMWAVELKDIGKMIGHVYFGQVQPKDFMEWTIGYIFNPKFYGNGYATEAAKAVMQYGFDELGVHRVFAKCNPDNTPSWKLLERLSMEREGCSMKRVCFIKDEKGQPIWWDEYQYAILQEEWPVFSCTVHK